MRSRPFIPGWHWDVPVLLWCCQGLAAAPSAEGGAQTRINPACALPGAEMNKCLSTLCLRQFLLINSRIFLIPFFKNGLFNISCDRHQFLVAEPIPHCLLASFLLL